MIDFNEQLEKLHKSRDDVLTLMCLIPPSSLRYIYYQDLVERLDRIIDVHVIRYVQAETYINNTISAIDVSDKSGLKLYYSMDFIGTYPTGVFALVTANNQAEALTLLGEELQRHNLPQTRKFTVSLITGLGGPGAEIFLNGEY